MLNCLEPDTTQVIEYCWCEHTILTIGSPESRVFILVALARVSASNWFNIMTLY